MATLLRFVIDATGLSRRKAFAAIREGRVAVDGSVAMTGSKRSHLASVSKPITAVALMNLLESSPSVTLDTPFMDILDSELGNAAPGVGNVTLRNLLQHRSGMKEWGNSTVSRRGRIGSSDGIDSGRSPIEMSSDLRFSSSSLIATLRFSSVSPDAC